MQHPERIGPFWVVQPIGPGATGITYLAVTDVSEASPPLIVCVKVPHSRWAADPRFRAGNRCTNHVSPGSRGRAKLGGCG